MHVQGPIWEMLALWSSAEGECKDGAHMEKGKGKEMVLLARAKQR